MRRVAALLMFVLAAAFGTRRAPPGAEDSVLVGPLARLASDFAWVRFQHARIAGAQSDAIRQAETALALDPSRSEAWALFASHIGLFLASVERGGSAEERLAWIETALAVLARGEAHVADPETLAFERGLILRVHAEFDPQSAWPGGTAGLWRDAAEAFRRATELGHPQAEGLYLDALERGAKD